MTAPAPAPRRPLPALDDLPHRLTRDIRIRDLDRQGHVNNVVFVTFFEAGRVMLLYDPRSMLHVAGTGFVLAGLTIDYLGEMRWPGDVTVATGLARLGRTSVTFAQALFFEGNCVAHGTSTVVLIDAASRAPRTFPPDVAASLRASAPIVPMRAGVTAPPGFGAWTDPSHR